MQSGSSEERVSSHMEARDSAPTASSMPSLRLTATATATARLTYAHVSRPRPPAHLPRSDAYGGSPSASTTSSSTATARTTCAHEADHPPQVHRQGSDVSHINHTTKKLLSLWLLARPTATVKATVKVLRSDARRCGPDLSTTAEQARCNCREQCRSRTDR
jgi:hypothetical protein